MKTAIVIGAGVAGMAAAKVLAESHSVTVFEAQMPAQSQHLHVLLKAGQESLERIFPGILSSLRAEGCPEIDWAQDTVWENHQGSFPRYESGLRTLSMGRIHLMEQMRARCEKDGVSFIQKRVESLSELKADLVVLAAGASFPLKRFLGECVREKCHPVDLTYRSYVYPQEELSLPKGGQYYYQIDVGSDHIGGVISPMGNGKTMVTLIEKEKEFTPCRDLDGFKALAQQIPSKEFSRIIADGRPSDGPFSFRKRSIHRRQISTEKIPDNVVVIGDALASLNPVFGQGMSIALLQAELLGRMLGETFSSKKFHSLCQRQLDLAHRLSLLGSQESGIGKYLLRTYLRLAQSSKGLHHLFINQLHSLKVIP